MLEGLAEVPGGQSNPVILQWAVDLGIADIYTNDDTAWCALAWNRVNLGMQLPLSGTRYELLRAKSAAGWGEPLTQAALGATLVFSRPEGHHVGWYIGERADAYRVLGGNTSNRVTSAWIAKSRLVAVRWPAGVPRPAEGSILLATGGSLSENEA